MSNIPTDPALYLRIKKKVFKKYPKNSAYRSGLLVREYKAKMKERGKKPYTGKKTTKGLHRWFKEDWKNQRGEKGYQKRGDIYRPTKRISKDTPTTMKELTKTEIKRAQREKKVKGRVSKFKKESTKEQKETLKEHSKHHTKKHMKMMRDMMKEGKTFRQAHNRAKKLVRN
jgi:hypothetical protein